MQDHCLMYFHLVSRPSLFLSTPYYTCTYFSLVPGNAEFPPPNPVMDTPKKRQIRTVFTKEQTDRLLEIRKHTTHPDRLFKEQLAAEFGMKINIIDVSSSFLLKVACAGFFLVLTSYTSSISIGQINDFFFYLLVKRFFYF